MDNWVPKLITRFVKLYFQPGAKWAQYFSLSASRLAQAKKNSGFFNLWLKPKTTSQNILKLERVPDPDRKLAVNKPNIRYYTGPNLSQAAALFSRLEIMWFTLELSKAQNIARAHKALAKLSHHKSWNGPRSDSALHKPNLEKPEPDLRSSLKRPDAPKLIFYVVGHWFLSSKA